MMLDNGRSRKLHLHLYDSYVFKLFKTGVQNMLLYIQKQIAQKMLIINYLHLVCFRQKMQSAERKTHLYWSNTLCLVFSAF